MPTDRLPPLAVGIEAKVAFLKDSSAYPERPAEVRAIETHMSWVFLAGTSVYKLKKPVRYSYLDFSTLPARSRYCSEEIRLNRRLAPGTYLARIPLTQAPDGSLSLDGSGTVVDWLVKMRHLPEERMLDRLIREKALQPGELARLMEVLVRFYARAKPATFPPGAYGQRLRQALESNAAALLIPRYRLPAASIRSILAAQRRFVMVSSRLLEERAETGHVVDCHGDLRPEHICLERRPVIIDCLEFNRDLRLLDIADELAFLALECERLGSEEAGRQLMENYVRLSSDIPSDELVAFYKSCRACLRAKLTVWHLDEEAIRNPQKWRRQTLDYLALAGKYAAALSPPADP